MEAMESAMGLGFVLEFKDMASSGIEKAKVKIDELKQHTADLTSVFDKNLTRIKMAPLKWLLVLLSWDLC